MHLTNLRRLSSLIRLSSEVKSALNLGKPVVALESTVITHGLPYPNNLEVGRELQRIIKDGGGTPATIALMAGEVRVGLSEAELDEVANPEIKAFKVSTRDIANVLTSGKIGGTTVAATTKIAAIVGIKVFATGGIGGVHREAEKTFDISNDLISLGQNPVVVVCAGAKSILDVSKTLEFLETAGTNVIVFDKEPWFPGFFTRQTTCKAPFNTDSLDKIAQIIKTTDALKLSNGTLVACPLPKEFTDESGCIEQATRQALSEANKQSICGKAVTPFLLKRVNDLTNNVSMKLNIALLKNNAEIAVRLATKLSNTKPLAVSPTKHKTEQTAKKLSILCIGGSIYDMEVVSKVEPKNDGGSYPSRFFERAGGVARNHAEAFTRLGCDAHLITTVGNDLAGRFLFPSESYVNAENVYWLDNVATATYLAVNVDGNIQHGFSAIERASEELTPSRIKAKASLFESVDYVLLEGNLQPQTLRKCVELAEVFGKKIWYDPTDLKKVWKVIDTNSVDKFSAFSPNLNEFVEYCKCLGVLIPEGSLASLEVLADFINANKSFLHRVFPEQMQILLITMGASGCLLLNRVGSEPNVQITTVPAPLAGQAIVSASGSGDCFNAAFLIAHLNDACIDNCMRAGQRAAGLSLQSLKTVPKTIRFDTVIKPFL